ncbi:Serpentine Receptor, class BC (Class B-like) [Caenorhabditis elegans]|uniref:Serpentine Receptor, class BC (Class B-like) n=1 Tax=Caenorhabditis elegans TaxID=6239 RepID=O44700_CAEEL|nr:Serpentine Receptor, class BC (Class B-like) [Caenorhabditis elegans]CCD67426.1 Serpentine Receptor, class BC (Class B-like) [Caenorhabditis elegans]|eukprot:NP_503588.1 Serpentine Receptor, class BC (class B-like) [Caenorhabditis elegans]
MHTEQPKMNISAVTISIFGVVSSVFSCAMNFYFLVKTERKKKDMALFYFRFSVDVLQGSIVCVYLLFVIAYSLIPEELRKYHNLIFYLGFPSSNVDATRSMVSLAISMERVAAAYIPIFFHNYRKRFPAVIIFMIAVIYGLNEDIVLYVFCNFKLNIPKNCAALGCAMNTCFFHYWTHQKSVTFTITFVCLLLLCAKLFIFNELGRNGRKELSRVNRLALIDSTIVCVFDFVPNFIANQFAHKQFFSFQNIGPYIVVTKLAGCAIEACFVFWTFNRKTFKIKAQPKSRLPCQLGNFTNTDS